MEGERETECGHTQPFIEHPGITGQVLPMHLIGVVLRTCGTKALPGLHKYTGPSRPTTGAVTPSPYKTRTLKGPRHYQLTTKIA